jgi:hypothetical protein
MFAGWNLEIPSILGVFFQVKLPTWACRQDVTFWVSPYYLKQHKSGYEPPTAVHGFHVVHVVHLVQLIGFPIYLLSFNKSM